MALDPEQRSRLLGTKIRVLVDGHWPVDLDAPGLVREPVGFGGGAAVVAGERAWVLLDGADHGLGSVLAWASRRGIADLDILADTDADPGVLARRRRASSPTRRRCGRSTTRRCGPAVPTPWRAPVPPADDVIAAAEALERAGLDVVVDHGVVSGEILGLEVARVVVGRRGRRPGRGRRRSHRPGGLRHGPRRPPARRRPPVRGRHRAGPAPRRCLGPPPQPPGRRALAARPPHRRSRSAARVAPRGGGGPHPPGQRERRRPGHRHGHRCRRRARGAGLLGRHRPRGRAPRRRCPRGPRSRGPAGDRRARPATPTRSPAPSPPRCATPPTWCPSRATGAAEPGRSGGGGWRRPGSRFGARATPVP